MKREEVMEIIDLALQVNGMGERTTELTGTLPTVFTWFSGHVSTLTIDIHRDGWFTSSDYDEKFNFFTDRPTNYAAMQEYKKYMHDLMAEKGL